MPFWVPFTCHWLVRGRGGSRTTADPPYLHPGRGQPSPEEGTPASASGLSPLVSSRCLPQVWGAGGMGVSEIVRRTRSEGCSV